MLSIEHHRQRVNISRYPLLSHSISNAGVKIITCTVASVNAVVGFSVGPKGARVIGIAITAIARRVDSASMLQREKSPQPKGVFFKIRLTEVINVNCLSRFAEFTGECTGWIFNAQPGNWTVPQFTNEGDGIVHFRSTLRVGFIKVHTGSCEKCARGVADRHVETVAEYVADIAGVMVFAAIVGSDNIRANGIRAGSAKCPADNATTLASNENTHY